MNTDMAYRAAKTQLADRNWRLDHLYRIRIKEDTEEGQVLQFKRNPAQQDFCFNQWYRDDIVKARQLGFSTLIEILILDDALFRRDTIAGIIDYRMNDAKKKLEKCRFAYNGLPSSIRDVVRLIKDNAEELRFSNGSSISAGTGFRGDTAQILHVSEYGKISAERPEVAREIKLGAFQAVPQHGKLYVESTAHGRGGEFYELTERAKKAQDSGRQLSPKDFKLHFYPWHLETGYRMQSNLVLLEAELIAYFEELEYKHGIRLDAQQRAWYQAAYNEVGPDDIFSEYPSVLDEAFFSSLKGAYFKTEMVRARREQRIGWFPHDPTRPVNTWHDLGVDDEHAIWFHQTDGLRHWFIDFASASGEGLSWVVRILDEKQAARGFRYGKHYGPHDLEVREWASPNAQPRWKSAEDLGLKFVIVPRVHDKADAIEAARRLLGLSFFDEKHCAHGISGLESYSKKWIEKLATWGTEPLHNWASHIADAYMTGATGLQPDRPAGGKRSGNRRPQGASPWSA
jgi:hypothetical protein